MTADTQTTRTVSQQVALLRRQAAALPAGSSTRDNCRREADVLEALYQSDAPLCERTRYPKRRLSVRLTRLALEDEADRLLGHTTYDRERTP